MTTRAEKGEEGQTQTDRPHISWNSDVKENKATGRRPLTIQQKQNLPDPAKEEMAKNKKLPCSLQHFAHSLPGFTEGAGARQRIEPWPFQDLLEHQHPVVIPLFQRKYCWGKAQGDKWWADLINMKLENCKRGFWHGVGKVVFKIREDEGIICIDGQQRTTTTSLLLTSIQEAFHQKRRELVKETAAAGADEQKAADAIQERIAGYLFMKPEEAKQWALQTWAAWKAKGPQEELFLNDFIPDGLLLSFARLHPSHIDRQPYFQCLLKSVLQATAAEAGVSEEQLPAFVEGSVTTESLQGQMKKLFDAKVQQYFGEFFEKYLQSANFKEQVPSGSQLEGLCALTRALLTKALMGMSFTYVEVLNEVNLAQVFHFLQERSLFGPLGLLHNPSPGLDFRSADLARNLLLCPTMNWRTKDQETAHLLLWIQPIEGYFPRPVDIDRVIKALLDDEEQTRKEERESKARNQALANARNREKRDASSADHNTSSAARSLALPSRAPPPPPQHWLKDLGRHISSFEKQVKGLLDLFKNKGVGKKEIDGMVLYAEFYSFYEEGLLKRMEEKEPEESDNGRWSQIASTINHNKTERDQPTSSCPPLHEGELNKQEVIEWTFAKEVLRRLGDKAKQMKEEEGRIVV